MKTHRSRHLFFYCSGGESSVKCVRTALVIEKGKEDQRGVVRFLVVEDAVTRHKVKASWNVVGRNHPFQWRILDFLSDHAFSKLTNATLPLLS